MWSPFTKLWAVKYQLPHPCSAQLSSFLETRSHGILWFGDFSTYIHERTVCVHLEKNGIWSQKSRFQSWLCDLMTL